MKDTICRKWWSGKKWTSIYDAKYFGQRSEAAAERQYKTKEGTLVKGTLVLPS